MPKEKKTEEVATPVTPEDITYDELCREAANLTLTVKTIMLRLAIVYSEMQKRISDAVS